MGTVEGPRDTKPALKEKRGVCFRESGHMFVSAGQDTPRSVWLPPVMCSQPQQCTHAWRKLIYHTCILCSVHHSPALGNVRRHPTWGPFMLLPGGVLQKLMPAAGNFYFDQPKINCYFIKTLWVTVFNSYTWYTCKVFSSTLSIIYHFPYQN